ncbi:hypothetical protein TSOC_004730 [Tetrabaena socialis]|uniref:Uncharacterized protein n=1 Tax=Tetrabaena socialis TaxID=47790 RepID=A0A2J8A847_9CHLO|nr:hypothetical protein TSOC_004730 [Tetrabaena socialis]|eukprot:PNH08709.1 hypothetical protein TSOC_004730 [Tetrabaena socialis]
MGERILDLPVNSPQHSGGGANGVNGVNGSSKLTQGSGDAFGGSLARDLRKWKGAAAQAPTPGSGGGGAERARVAAVLGGGNGLSLTLLQGGQLDPKALLEELKRWKLETADKVLFVDPDEASSAADWVGAEGSGIAATAADNLRTDILHLGSGLEAVATGLDVYALGLALDRGPEPASSPTLPSSPSLVPARPPAGAAAASRRKMVLAKVVRDIAADSVGSSGASISEILAGLRPVHAPHGKGGGGHVPSIAWGPGPADAPASPSPSASPAPSPHHQSHYQPQHQPQQQQLQQHPLPQGTQRSGSGQSVCSSSGQSDQGQPGGAAAGPHSHPSRPGSREEAAAAGSGGAHGALLRQRSGSRVPGLPAGPSAPQAPYRILSVAGEVDVRGSNPQPMRRLDEG